jgi:phage repressor protein C with HTH and peptisase S24 domain
LSSVDRYCRNQSAPPAARLGEIARACNVSSDSIIFGGEIAPIVPMTRTQLIASADNDDEEVASIPLLDVIASAGPGIENPFPLAIDHLPFPKRWLEELGLPEKHARFLGARGDSMEPTILDGAICLADIRFQVPRIDGVYALIDGNDVRIKRIARGWEGKIVLISDNERYESETLAAPEAEALRIAGKIVWAGGKI